MVLQLNHRLSFMPLRTICQYFSLSGKVVMHLLNAKTHVYLV